VYRCIDLKKFATIPILEVFLFGMKKSKRRSEAQSYSYSNLTGVIIMIIHSIRHLLIQVVLILVGYIPIFLQVCLDTLNSSPITCGKAAVDVTEFWEGNIRWIAPQNLRKSCSNWPPEKRKGKILLEMFLYMHICPLLNPDHHLLLDFLMHSIKN
jgi:hypothetical protein